MPVDLPRELQRYLEDRPTPARPLTRDTYGRILQRAGAIAEGEPLDIEAQALVDWLRERVGPHIPKGTVLPLRAAIKHYLVSVLGLSEDDANEILPPARGLETPGRDALTDAQLDLYLDVVRAMPEGPIRCILLLLPHTGMRIAEICALRFKNIEAVGDGNRRLAFEGKGGKFRVIPVTSDAAEILDPYLEWRGTGAPDWLFLGHEDGHITPNGVRHHTRAIAALFPDLKGLTPHRLRHTWGTLAMDALTLREVQWALGHKRITTTERYTHPVAERVGEKMERIRIGRKRKEAP